MEYLTRQPRRYYEDIHSIIMYKECKGRDVEGLFEYNVYSGPLWPLLGRIVVALTNKVEVEELMSTALCCVNYSTPNVSCVTTAGLSFGAGEHLYIATSLHGKFNANKQHIPTVERALILADAFGTDDEKLTGAGEVGYVVCDWRTEYLDVGLVQLHDEHTSAGVWFTQEQVVEYMVKLMKDTYDIDWDSPRVHIHSASCFSSGAGVDRIPGKLIRVWHLCWRSGNGGTRNWQLLVRCDPGYEIVPGQSGSAVTLVSNGRPIGMLVARVSGSTTEAIVTPLHYIYASINSVLPTDQKVHLCSCHQCPVTAAASQRATKLITDQSLTVYCKGCNKPLRLYTDVDGGLDGCCRDKSELVDPSPLRRMHSHLSLCEPANLPVSCAFWRNW